MSLGAVMRKTGGTFSSSSEACSYIPIGVGFLDLAFDFARSGRTDPRTLSRASRDLVEDAQFSLGAKRLALRLMDMATR